MTFMAADKRMNRCVTLRNTTGSPNLRTDPTTNFKKSTGETVTLQLSTPTKRTIVFSAYVFLSEPPVTQKTGSDAETWIQCN